jgi:hypothetical protein
MMIKLMKIEKQRRRKIDDKMKKKRLMIITMTIIENYENVKIMKIIKS